VKKSKVEGKVTKSFAAIPEVEEKLSNKMSKSDLTNPNDKSHGEIYQVRGQTNNMGLNLDGSHVSSISRLSSGYSDLGRTSGHFGHIDKSIHSANSGMSTFFQRELTLNVLLKVDLRSLEHVEYVFGEMEKHRKVGKPYKSFFPLKRVKGTVKKVHRLGMNTYFRFIYINPIEGVLISYQNQSKFPHSASYMIKLDEIKECAVLFQEKQSKWFFKRGHYYFVVRSESKTSYFFLDNLDLANHWTSEILKAKEFYEWFQSLTALRYSPNHQNSLLTSNYEYIVNNVISAAIPECDLDQYQPSMKIDAKQFSIQVATSFLNSQTLALPAEDDA
jgi:hypothetical protein